MWLIDREVVAFELGAVERQLLDLVVVSLLFAINQIDRVLGFAAVGVKQFNLHDHVAIGVHQPID